MNVIFFDRQDQENPLHGVVVRDRERLLQILNGLLIRPPFVCELQGENDFLLHVGVGEFGQAQYSRADGKPPYLMAVAPDPGPKEEDIEFLLGGTPTPISKRYCMPFKFICEIAGYFVETGRAHPGFSWEDA